ncbi:RNA-guided endonuclease IscB [Malikia sp.]|uniref:RNA-guided endonuclease IscB n=1 Tax=Malikia sp. TaxID=2070706 RepID=UPI00260FAE4E|nr:RNA-guided endonuclease IscB [Malikia sp.]
MPCTEKRARLLLERGRARVHRLVPFVIRLVDRQVTDCALQPLRVKLDPGSKGTGLALVRDTEQVDANTGEIQRGASVLNLMELVHRGREISEALTARRQMRRRRRGANLRYRAPGFLNRRRHAGWLAPSLQHRVDTTRAWVTRIQRWAPVAALSSELVRFDTQALDNPDIEGAQYQQGTLAGYEVREYLLEKWGRQCAYCDATGVPLQVEHIHPKARGGTNRVSNLTLACQACNARKGALPLEVFVTDKARLARIQAQRKRPLKDAAAVNSTRKVLVGALQATGLPVETVSGGRTKYNRIRFKIEKTHALDAVCVGDVDIVTDWDKPTLALKCTGRGSYQRTRLNQYGFPRGYLMRTKRVKGFATGDLVRAEMPKGKKVGTHIGRVAVRASGSFNIQTGTEVVQGISHRHCQVLQRADGYGYFHQQNLTRKDAGEGRAKRTTRSASPA